MNITRKWEQQTKNNWIEIMKEEEKESLERWLSEMGLPVPLFQRT